MRTLFRTASQNSKVRSELTDVLDARPQIFALVPTGSGWRYTMKTSAIALSLWLLASPVGAQWPTFPTPGIPRTADGKPNLAAPAPRTPDGKPDFSGLWAPAPADFIYAFDVIQDPKDESIFLPPAEALFKKHLSDFRRDNPVGHCLPGGPVNILTGLHRIMQSPTVMAMLYQLGSNWYRQIFLDGRQLPRDPNPAWFGYSVGHWDGDILVVDTAGFNDRTWLDMAGHPHSEQLRVTERLRRIDFGHIQRQITFDDPQTLTKPLTFSLPLSYALNTEIQESICEDRDSAHLVGKANARAQLSSAVLAKYVGTYQYREGPMDVALAMGLTQRVTLIEGQLYLQALPLIAQTETKFESTGAAAEFLVDKNGAVTHLVLSLTEGDAKYDRKP